jgi:hypothetical protein
MRVWQVLAILFVLALVAACSTTVNTRQGLEQDVIRNLKFSAVEATSGLNNVTADDLAQFKKAVVDRIARLCQGDRAVRIQLTITGFDIISVQARFFAGAFAGTNKMTTAVKVIDESEKAVADFDVQRSANPGGYGVFYDQKAATIDSVADGVVEVLGGKNGGCTDK